MQKILSIHLWMKFINIAANIVANNNTYNGGGPCIKKIFFA